MTATDKEFTGSIPELYDRSLVPLIFQPYADDLAERVRKLNPRDLLETAAGTGAVTRAIAALLPGSARMVITDLNDAMLDYARSTIGQETRIDWKQADALALPFSDQTFDVVICQFGVMFFPDKVQGFREARRVLRSSGTYLFSVWDSLSDNEFADVVTSSLAEMFPQDPPQFLARTPHGHHDAEEIRQGLLAAGFSHVEFETLEHVSRCASPREPAVAYCQGTPLRNEIIARDPSCLEAATQHATAALARRFGPGPIEGRIRAIVFTAKS